MLKAFIIFGMVGEAGLGISLSGNLYKKEVFLQLKHSLQISRKLQISRPAGCYIPCQHAWVLAH